MTSDRAMEKIATLNKRINEMADDIRVYKTYIMVEGAEFGLREEDLEKVSEIIDNWIKDIDIDTEVSNKALEFLELCGFKHLRNKWYWT